MRGLSAGVLPGPVLAVAPHRAASAHPARGRLHGRRLLRARVARLPHQERQEAGEGHLKTLRVKVTQDYIGFLSTVHYCQVA